MHRETGIPAALAWTEKMEAKTLTQKTKRDRAQFQSSEERKMSSSTSGMLKRGSRKFDQ